MPGVAIAPAGKGMVAEDESGAAGSKRVGFAGGRTERGEDAPRTEDEAEAVEIKEPGREDGGEEGGAEQVQARTREGSRR